MIVAIFAFTLLLFAGLFVGMLAGLMASLPSRARMTLSLTLMGAFALLGWRSPNPTLSTLIMTICPGMTLLAWVFGSLKSRQERERGVGTKPNR